VQIDPEILVAIGAGVTAVFGFLAKLIMTQREKIADLYDRLVEESRKNADLSAMREGRYEAALRASSEVMREVATVANTHTGARR
jgi:hypothetical protein